MRFSQALTAVVLISTISIHAQTTAPAELPGAYWSVYVDLSRAGLQSDFDANRLLMQSVVEDHYIRRLEKELRIPAAVLEDAVKLHVETWNAQGGWVQIQVDFSRHPEVSRSAAEVAQKIADAMQDEVTGPMIEPVEENYRRSQEQVARAKDEIEKVAREMKELERQLNKLTGRGDVSPDALRIERGDIDKALRSLDVDVEARKARADALAQNIARLSAQIDERMAADPVVQELQKIVDIRTRKLERARGQVDSGQAPAGDVDEAAAEVAEARARLLDRKANAANAAGMELLSQWNRELLTLAIDNAEMQARQKSLRQRLDILLDAGDKSDQLAQLQAEMTRLKMQRDLRQAQAESERVRLDNMGTAKVSVVEKRSLKPEAPGGLFGGQTPDGMP